MKKLLSAALLTLGLFPAFAQDYPGAFHLTVKEEYLFGQPIVIHTEYLPGDPAADVSDYQWELQPVDADGNVGAPIYTESFGGDPSGDFVLPEWVENDMIEETNYQVSLTGTDAQGLQLASSASKFLYSRLTIESDNEVCCGTPISAFLNTAFDAPLGMTHRYTLWMCDANGNLTFPYPYYDSGSQPGFPPGAITFPNSEQLACDTYWRIDLTLNGSPNDARFRRTKIVYVTSFKMKTKSVYCCGQSLVVSAENCPGSQYTVTHHLWQAAPCQADGSNPGAPIYLGSGWGASGVNEILSAAPLTCGQYYRLICTFFNNNQTLQQRYQVIYIAAVPMPVITGPTTICGTGTYCVNNITNASYQWNTTYGSVFQSGGPNSSCFTTPIGNFTHVNVVVKDQYGCPSAYTPYPVTNNYISPAFYVWYITSLDANHFGIGFQRGSASGSTVDVFKVEEVSSTAPYTPVANTAWTNPCWSNTAFWYTPVYFFNYDGDGNGGYNGSTLSSCISSPYPQGNFRKDRTYKVTRTINNNGCISTMEIVFNMNGALSQVAYREGNIGMETPVETANAFSVFPNPNNGSFQVQLPSSAENVQGELFNTMGEKVDAFTFSGTSYSYSPSIALAKGIYLLRITNNGTVSTQRVMIE